MELKQKIISCIEETIEQSLTQENMSLNPIDDLDMDSILMVELILKVEDLFDITFSDFATLSENADTVESLVEFLCMEVNRMKGNS